VAAPHGQRLEAEPVGEQDDGVRDRSQAQTSSASQKSVEAIREHVGKAEPVRFRRR